MAPRNGPPDRWLEYSPMGDQIPRTRFICMKVPLKKHLTQRIADEEKFTCDMALDIAEEKGYKIGLVIDLSFTKRYYNPEDFTQKNVEYRKIFMPGREIPSKDIISEFQDLVLKFEEENCENDKLIAVHCTHGLNRTGYMICRFLIDKKKYNPEDAITAFNRARGHEIERAVYLNDLLGKVNKKAKRNGPEFSQRGKYSSGPRWDQRDQGRYDPYYGKSVADSEWGHYNPGQQYHDYQGGYVEYANSREYQVYDDYYYANYDGYGTGNNSHFRNCRENDRRNYYASDAFYGGNATRSGPERRGFYSEDRRHLSSNDFGYGNWYEPDSRPCISNGYYRPRHEPYTKRGVGHGHFSKRY